MFDGRVDLIRPMMDLDERMLQEYAELNKLVKVEKSCPHENSTQRKSIRQLIENIEELYGKGPYNIFKAMDKIFEEYLPRRD